MKKCTALIVLVMLMYQHISSIWTICAFYANQDYIARNICINRFDAVPICKGQCYLEKELKSDEKQQDKVPSVTYKEVQLFYENQITISFVKRICFIKKSYPILKKDGEESSYIFTIYHPPRCA
jgi:hypothetical protein